ncbi:MAG: hypothetical protein RLZ84_1681, partial [Actinomycetota bacterium]
MYLLQMQRHPGTIEADLLQIGVGMAKQIGEQRRKQRLAVQLPDAVQIAGPGAAG